MNQFRRLARDLEPVLYDKEKQLKLEGLGITIGDEYYINIPYTMTKITCNLNGENFEEVGFSKCCPKDVFSADRGTTISRGRALVALAYHVDVNVTWRTWTKEQAKVLEELFPSFKNRLGVID